MVSCCLPLTVVVVVVVVVVVSGVVGRRHPTNRCHQACKGFSFSSNRTPPLPLPSGPQGSAATPQNRSTPPKHCPALPDDTDTDTDDAVVESVAQCLNSQKPERRRSSQAAGTEERQTSRETPASDNSNNNITATKKVTTNT